MPRANKKCLKCPAKSTFRGYCDNHQPPRLVWAKPEDSRNYFKVPGGEAQRKRVLARDKFTCQYRLAFNCAGVASQVDHKAPVWYTGRDRATDSELAAICDPCHRLKSSAEGVEAKRAYKRGFKRDA